MAIDIRQIEKELTTTGVVGWIHGSVEAKGLYVFTYRNPGDFFDYILMSLVTDDSAMQAALASFHRHDKVRVKGKFLTNPSPQKHIAVTSVELVKKYESAYPSGPYPYDAALPDELLKKSKATFLIHAIAEEGHILVVEYKDAVTPMFAPDNSLVKELSRNDVVQFKYAIRKRPGWPIHLEIDKDAKRPVKLIESIKDINGKPARVVGTLVLFPQSPEISLNVFAVLQETKYTFNRQFTIVNFEQPEVFKGARDKLQKAWDRHPGEYVNGRNKLISKKLRVRVTGTYNQVSPNQANPQILIGSVEDVEILEE
jgi:hypothetical protein